MEIMVVASLLGTQGLITPFFSPGMNEEVLAAGFYKEFLNFIKNHEYADPNLTPYEAGSVFKKVLKGLHLDSITEPQI